MSDPEQQIIAALRRVADITQPIEARNQEISG
jgi:hypothetical protein